MENIKKDIFDKTESICPVCKEVIEADIIEENGSLWMEKTCDLHGFFKAKIAKYAWYYKGLHKLYKLICPNGHPHSKKNVETYILYPTLKCNLNCQICFSNSGPDNINKDLSLAGIRELVNAIKEPRRLIYLLGGEPTIRDDLYEIVRIILKAGHTPVLFTNGINLADLDYLKKLKMCGLKYISVWIETLRDDNIYEKIRGTKLLATKIKILDNFKTLNMTVRLFFVLVRGINEGEIGDVFNFVRRDNSIPLFSIASYVNLGRKGFSKQEEFTIDEIIEIICRESEGFITLEEFFLFQKLFYVTEVLFLNKAACYRQQSVLIPRNNNKKIREIFDLQKFAYYLDKFENIYRESPSKAKAYFLKKIFVRLIQNPKFLTTIIKQITSPGSHDNNYFRLRIGVLYTPYTYDIKYATTRCIQAWLPSYNNDKLVNFCSMIGNDCLG